MLKLIICGINGTMGSHLYNCALKRGYEIICGIDKITVGKTDCPVYNDFDQIKEFANVIVDFSSPSALCGLLNYATKNKLPLVLCTTGYTHEQEEKIKSASLEIPIFKSANTSFGVHVLLKLCKIATSLLHGYDIEIIEKHHKNKKDSPSGTANLIFNSIHEALPYSTPLCGRKEKSKRFSKEIGIHSIRGGSTVGEHSILFMGEHDSITITHEATNKELFAKGALLACDFIKNKQSGLYNMNDLV